MARSNGRGWTAGVALSAGVAASASAQLRVAIWNISLYNGGRQSEIQTVVYGTNPSNGLTMRPDVILLQEMVSATALAEFASHLNTAPGSPGDWAAATYVDGADNDNAMVYRTGKLQLVGVKVIGVGSSSTANQPRNTMRYDIRPVGYTAPGATIGCYNTHMKAQGGTNSAGRRLIEAQRIRDNAEGVDTNPPGSALPAGYQFLVGGDFNVQNSADPEYVEMVGSQANNAGRFFDPIAEPGGWNNNSAFRFVHTQDPSGAGGMDDRHDQILLGAGLLDMAGFDYVGLLTSPQTPVSFSASTWNDPNHSYRAWGNDGTSFDLTMTIAGNTMVGPTIAQAVVDSAPGGGHIPVFLDLRVPPKAGASTMTINFGTVTQGSTAQQAITVSNAGNTGLWNVAGIANLSYTLAASSGFTAPGGGFVDTASPGGNAHTISMNTSTTGPKNGTLTIASNDLDQPTLIVNLVGNVTPSNTPPNANAGADQSLVDTDGGGDEPVTLDGSASTDPGGTITNYKWMEGVAVLANGPSATANVTLAVGVHTITLEVTDNGLLMDTDDVVITVDPPPCVADVDDGSGTGTLDGTVDISDLLYYLTLFDAGNLSSDVDDGSGSGTPDGGVDISDLLYFLFRFDAGC